MFESNKYLKWYLSLCARAEGRSRGKGMEKHHVIPKSLGGDNSKENLVLLSYREHFLAHWILTKITKDEAQIKMKRALWAMTWVSKSNFRIVSGWQYALARANIPEIARANGKAGKGRVMSEAHKLKIKNALLGKPKTEEHKAKLRLLSPSKEHREAISKKLKGRTYSDEVLAKMKAANKGRKHSDETKAKLSKALKGRVFTEEWRTKISIKVKGRKLPPFSDDHKRKLSKSAKLRKRDSNGHFI